MNFTLCSNIFHNFFLDKVLESKQKRKIRYKFFENFIITNKYNNLQGCFFFSRRLLNLNWYFDKIFGIQTTGKIVFHKNLENNSKKRRRFLNIISKNKNKIKRQTISFPKLTKTDSRKLILFDRFYSSKSFYLYKPYLFLKEYSTLMKRKVKREFILFEIMFQNFFFIKESIIDIKKKINIESNRRKFKMIKDSMENQFKLGKIFKICGRFFLKQVEKKIKGFKYKQNRIGNNLLRLFEIDFFSETSFKKITWLSGYHNLNGSLKNNKLALLRSTLNYSNKFLVNEYGYEL